MSTSFYEDASLVLVPSGYKTSKVYCAKPTDGAADLSFTRSNDTATRVGPDGLIEKVRTNLLTYSNTFNTTWSTTNASVTSGQAGYDGTNNAWLLSKTGDFGRVEQSTSVTGLYAFSVYAKAGTLNFMSFELSGIASDTTFFDLQNGVVGIKGTNALFSSIESVGNGWYRCSAVFDGTLGLVRIQPSVANGTVNGSNGNILIQDAQLEAGDIATPYIGPTTSAAVSVGPVANVPRLDYLNSSCPRLLLEGQRQNLALFSESFDNAGWTKTETTISANAATSPDGYTNADKLIASTNNAAHETRQSFSGLSGSYTISCFLKASEYNFAFVRSQVNLGADRYGVIIDLTNGTTYTNTTGSPTGVSHSVTSYGNGWYRLSLTATTSSFLAITIGPANGTTFGGNSLPATFAGNGTDGVLAYGAMAEAGAYPTSYIPTLGAAVTRGADACSKTGISSLIGQTQGVLFVDFVQNNTPAAGVNQWLFFLGSGSTYIAIYVSGQKLRAEIANTTDQAVINTSYNLVAGTRYKAALAYKENDFAFYVNGVQIGVDTSGTVPAVSTLQNNYTTTAANSSNAGLNQALLFKTRLTNESLASLTSL